jgi:hypothetical protein
MDAVEKLMGLREYSRHRGCHLKTVQEAIWKGRIPVIVVEGRKMIEPVGADKAWELNVDPSKRFNHLGSKVQKAVQSSSWLEDEFDLDDLSLMLPDMVFVNKGDRVLSSSAYELLIGRIFEAVERHLQKFIEETAEQESLPSDFRRQMMTQMRRWSESYWSVRDRIVENNHF